MKTATPGILRHLPIIAVELDTQLNIIDHSPPFNQWTQDDCIGSHLSEMIPGALYLQLREHLHKAQTGCYVRAIGLK